MYIDNYPATWKYISLFAKTDDAEKDAEVNKTRELNMEKIQKTMEYKVKFREQEIIKADIQVDYENYKRAEPADKIAAAKKDKKDKKKKSKVEEEDSDESSEESSSPEKGASKSFDPFFVEDSEDAEMDDKAEKRVV